MKKTQGTDPSARMQPMQGNDGGRLHHHEPRQPVTHGRSTFRHVAGNQQRPGSPPNMPLRRAPRGPSAQSARQADAQDNRGLDNDDRDDDEDAGAGGKGGRGHDLDADLGSDSRQTFSESRDEEARRRALLNARLLPGRGRPPAAQVLARSGLPGAAALVVRHGCGAIDPKEQLQALASVLLGCTGLGSTGDKSLPSPATVVLAALQQHLSGQAGAPPGPMSLGDVKSLLMSLPPAPPLPAGGEDRLRTENALLLLPLFLLNATRPRTDGQRRRSIDCLQLLRAGVGGAS